MYSASKGKRVQRTHTKTEREKREKEDRDLTPFFESNRIELKSLAKQTNKPNLGIENRKEKADSAASDSASELYKVGQHTGTHKHVQDKTGSGVA